MGVTIRSMAAVVPKEVLGIDDVKKHFPHENVERITASIGVQTRHVAPDHSTLRLAYEAGYAAIEKAGIAAESLGGIIVVTQSPEYRLPSTACILQDKLGLKKGTVAFDMNLGCSGFPYGYLVAQSMIQNRITDSILLICGDVTSINAAPEDTSTYPLFADGFGAVILGEAEDNSLLGYHCGTDGAGWNNLVIHTGMARHRTKESFYESGEDKLYSKVKYPDYVYMDGAKVFTFCLKEVPEMLKQTLQMAELKAEDIDCFCFHQANHFLVEHLRQKIGIPSEKVPICIERYGNTSSSSVILAACDAYGTQENTKEKRIAFLAFGVGFSYASVLLKIAPDKIAFIKEV